MSSFVLEGQGTAARGVGPLPSQICWVGKLGHVCWAWSQCLLPSGQFSVASQTNCGGKRNSPGMEGRGVGSTPSHCT